MKKSVGITLSQNSYTPEAYAYETYLRSNGVDVELGDAKTLDPFHDTHIYFMGLLPFWKKKGRWHEIHEYQSLSTPPFAKSKNLLKINLNRQPDSRIFLNESVRDNLSFKDVTPYIYRDMGVDDGLFQQPSENPTFDIVYSGSVTGRTGLVEQIARLADLGFKILIIGTVSSEIKSTLSPLKYKIEFTGRVDRKDLPALYGDCRFGLNYTPDFFPYNIQTSTKTLEYLASGLNVISNRYPWSESFFKKNKGLAIWINDLSDMSNISDLQRPKLSFSEYSWSSILNKMQFIKFVLPN